MSISTIFVGLIVLAAVFYMMNHFRKISNGTGGCASCGGSSSCSSCRAGQAAAHDEKRELPPCCCEKK